jgi:dihydroorotase
MITRIEIPRPDDWHLHLRDGAALVDLVPHTARQFGRAIVMPNLKPPVTTVEMALAYRERILAAVPSGVSFEPLMTLYLTPATSVADVEAAAKCPHVHGVKLYPAGATTNSDSGVRELDDRVLAAMADHGVPLLVHGESIDPKVDVFDREAVFVADTLSRVVDRHPELRIVLEHVSTAEAVAWVRGAPAHVGATITAHHLLYDRNAMFDGGVRPHMYCLPVLKRAKHREALVAAATSGDPKFFLGTDSAPHQRVAKEASCGCAGAFTAHAAIELYAEAFERAGAIEKLEGFASRFGAAFYGLPVARETIVLEREAWTVPGSYPLAGGELVPLRAGEMIAWRLTSRTAQSRR